MYILGNWTTAPSMPMYVNIPIQQHNRGNPKRQLANAFDNWQLRPTVTHQCGRSSLSWFRVRKWLKAAWEI